MRNRWLILFAVIVALFLTVFIVGQFTPVLTDLVLKQAIDATTFTSPPNFDSIEKTSS